METVSQGPGSRAGRAGTETSEAGAGLVLVLVLVTLPGTMRGHLALLTRDPGNPGITLYLTALKYLYYTPTEAVLMSHIFLLLFFNLIEFLVNSSEC